MKLKVWLVVIVIVAAFLRLYRLPETLQFLGDQGRDALVMYDLVKNHNLPFIGPITSVGGFYLGPLYYYLMAPFLWLFRYSPVGPAYATAVLGIITVWALYRVAKHLFDQKTALISSALFALGSVPIVETRGAWNPNPMPLAVLGIVYGFVRHRQSGQLKWLLLSAISLGAALQFHYMIVFFAPFILWQLWLILKDAKLRTHLWWYFACLLAVNLPLILFELKNNFLNINGLLAYLSKNDHPEFTFWQQLKNINGRSQEAIGMLLGFGRTTTALRTGLSRLLLILIGWQLLKKPSPSFKLLSAWLLPTIVAIAFYVGNIPPYYLAFLFPVTFMFVGYFLSKTNSFLLPISLTFIALFLSFNLATIKEELAKNGNLRSVQTTAQIIKADIDSHQYTNYNLTLLDGTKDYRASSFRYFLTVYGGQPLSIAQYPDTKVLYVISPYFQENPLAEGIWEIKSLGQAQVTQTWEFPDHENIYKIEKQ